MMTCSAILVATLFSASLVRRNFDELFDLPFPFAAVPDIYKNLGFKLHSGRAS
ncbi:hypothetical protein BGW80DRAFT_1337874 [Lactifluus volemus]|nr:hypothetical protein BGW80DRAFT_1337874 [Lactifluus volemus]